MAVVGYESYAEKRNAFVRRRIKTIAALFKIILSRATNNGEGENGNANAEHSNFYASVFSAEREDAVPMIGCGNFDAQPKHIRRYWQQWHHQNKDCT